MAERKVFWILLLWLMNVSVSGFHLWENLNSPCSREQFRCRNQKCVPVNYYCDNGNDCGDKSDEEYCNVGSGNCPTSYPLYKCKDSQKCIPVIWKCDGIKQCPNGDDEYRCEDPMNQMHPYVTLSKFAALKWIVSQSKKKTITEKWGLQAHRIAVALYLAEPNDFENAVLQTGNEESFKATELAYELSIQLLSRLSRKKIKSIPTTELALYVNAMIVSCVDPRKFHAFNLISELRSRVDKQNYTNPLVMLAMCNAGEKITESDVTKLMAAFEISHRQFWTDTQSIAIMALACAAAQDNASIETENLKPLTMELKKKQFMNGTVENLRTSALVMQALSAAETEYDDANFDGKNCMLQIVQSQLPDGSFGDMLTTYLVLPVLSYKTLLDVSSAHCKHSPKKEEEALSYLLNEPGPKWHIRFSLWIGDEKDIVKTLELSIPFNTSFYGIMEIASEVDSRYRFLYNVKNGKVYIYSISGIHDDPENGKFWFSYYLKDESIHAISQSPSDFVPENDAHLVFWYKRGSWIES